MGSSLLNTFESVFTKTRSSRSAFRSGPFIGVKMVEARLELFSAYVVSGQFINATDGDALGYELTLKQARATNNHEAITALEAMGPPPWPDVRTRSDLKNLVDGIAFSTDPLVRDGMPFDARALAPRFPVPVFIFQGADDLNTPTELVRRWFAGLDAPAKEMVVVS